MPFDFGPIHNVSARPISTDVISFGFIGDAGSSTKKSKTLRESLKRWEVFNLVNAGDNLYSFFGDAAGRISSHLKDRIPHKSYEKVWKPWAEDGFRFFAVALGNHYKSIQEEMAYFRMPKEFYSRVDPREVVRIIVLNSNNGVRSAEQAIFLFNELEVAKEPFIFILCHHPSFTLVKGMHSSEVNLFHNPIKPLLIRYREKITALLFGHEHIALYASLFGIPCIVNGAGKGTTIWHPVLASDEGVIRWYKTGHPFWVHIQLNVATKIAQLDFINADTDQIECRLPILANSFHTI